MVRIGTRLQQPSLFEHLQEQGDSQTLEVPLCRSKPEDRCTTPGMPKACDALGPPPFNPVLKDFVDFSIALGGRSGIMLTGIDECSWAYQQCRNKLSKCESRNICELLCTGHFNAFESKFCTSENVDELTYTELSWWCIELSWSVVLILAQFH